MENLQILSDREVLTRTLQEVARLLQQSSPMTYKLSSYRALGRVLFLLRHLCRDHLSPQEYSQILDVSRELSRLLSEAQRGGLLQPLDYAQLPRLFLE